MCKMFFRLSVRRGCRSLQWEDVFPRTESFPVWSGKAAGVAAVRSGMQVERCNIRFKPIKQDEKDKQYLWKLYDWGGFSVPWVQRKTNDKRNHSEGVIFIFGARITNRKRRVKYSHWCLQKKNLASSTKQRVIFYIFIPGEVSFGALARSSSHRSLFYTNAEMWFSMYGSSAKNKVVFGFLKSDHVWSWVEEILSHIFGYFKFNW